MVTITEAGLACSYVSSPRENRYIVSVLCPLCLMVSGNMVASQSRKSQGQDNRPLKRKSGGLWGRQIHLLCIIAV